MSSPSVVIGDPGICSWLSFVRNQNGKRRWFAKLHHLPREQSRKLYEGEGKKTAGPINRACRTDRGTVVLRIYTGMRSEHGSCRRLRHFPLHDKPRDTQYQY